MTSNVASSAADAIFEKPTSAAYAERPLVSADRIFLTNPMTVNIEERNVILLDDITAMSRVTLKVKNLVIVGDINAFNGFDIHASEFIINLGKTRIEVSSEVRAKKIYSDGWEDEAVKKAEELGLKILELESGEYVTTAEGDKLDLTIYDLKAQTVEESPLGKDRYEDKTPIGDSFVKNLNF